MRTRYSLALSSALVALLSACGGSGGGSAGGPLPMQSATPPPTTAPAAANVNFVFHIPAIASASASSIAGRRVHKTDINATTQSVTIAMGTKVLTTANVSATSSLCAPASGGGRTCTVGVNAPNSTGQFTITAYDQPNASGNAIAQATMQVTSSPVNVALTGTIAKLTIALSNAYPNVGTPASVNVLVNAFDVDGNIVLGTYASPVTLQDTDTSVPQATSLSSSTVAGASAPVSLNYTGAQPFGTATITASAAGVAPVSVTFAPTPAFLNNYPAPTAPGRFGPTPVGPWNIVKGPDGNMWVSAVGIAQIIKVAPNGSFTQYPLAKPSDRLEGLVLGSDQNFWFPEEGNSSIGKMTTAGVITEYHLPQTTAFPSCIGLGADGNVWFFDGFNSVMGNITPSGTITEYPEPRTLAINAIVPGPDGNTWMTDIGDNAVIKVAASGQIVASYPLLTKQAEPFGLAVGPDKNIWVAEFAANKIARVTTSGSVSEFEVPSGSGDPIAIKAGPDGRMWFAEDGPFQGYGKIGYITTDGTQIRDFLGDGLHVHDLAFDANGMLWYVALVPPFGPQEIATFGI